MAIELTMENFNSMIDNVITGICFFNYEDGELTPIFINEGFFRMLGYSRVQGMKFLEKVELSIIPEDIPIYRQGIRDVLKDDGVVDVEFRTLAACQGEPVCERGKNIYHCHDYRGRDREKERGGGAAKTGGETAYSVGGRR